MTTPHAPHRIYITVEHPAADWAVRCLRRDARRFLTTLGHAGSELSLVVTGDPQIRTLNRDWRGKDKATDVLSFPQDPRTGLLGDVVISLDTAKAQAQEGGRPLSEELARLLAHGLLHLLGHDHEEPADAARMAKAEVELLGSVGLVGEALEHPAEMEFRRARRAAPETR